MLLCVQAFKLQQGKYLQRNLIKRHSTLTYTTYISTNKYRRTQRRTAYKKMCCFKNMRIKRYSLSNYKLLLLTSVVLTYYNLLNGASCSRFKYTHGPLASALSDGGSGGSGGIGISSSHRYGTKTTPSQIAAADDVVGSVDNGVDSGEEPTENVGEILVPKTFPMSPQEPTCEQLRAMWIFSKRQSRATEITNEIPTYRDPFAYNIWEPYYSTTRRLGTVRMLLRFGEHARSPVFGRVVSREPTFPQRLQIAGIAGDHRQRYVGELNKTPRIYGAEAKAKSGGISTGGTSTTLTRRPIHSQYRYMGANGSSPSGSGCNSATGNTAGISSGSNSNSIAKQGSFQKLKELIWTERAKELTDQRRAEELAARAAVLKEIVNGQSIQSSYKHAPLKSDSPLMDENRSADADIYQHMNGGRMSIASGQSHANSNTNSKNNNTKNEDKNLKSHGNGKISSNRLGQHHNVGNTHKPSIFSANAIMSPSSPGRASHVVLPSMIGAGYLLDNYDDVNSSTNSITGTSKIYPIRTPHFRERILNKILPPTDYFQRNLRRSQNTTTTNSAEVAKLILNNIINNLKTYLQPDNKIAKQKYDNKRKDITVNGLAGNNVSGGVDGSENVADALETSNDNNMTTKKNGLLRKLTLRNFGDDNERAKNFENAGIYNYIYDTKNSKEFIDDANDVNAKAGVSNNDDDDDMAIYDNIEGINDLALHEDKATANMLLLPTAASFVDTPQLTNDLFEYNNYY